MEYVTSIHYIENRYFVKSQNNLDLFTLNDYLLYLCNNSIFTINNVNI